MDIERHFLLPPPSSSSEEAAVEYCEEAITRKSRERELLLGKLCIICPCVFEDSNYECCILILDLEEEESESGGGKSSKEFTPRVPTLRIEGRYGFDVYAYCVLGRRLYLFVAEVEVGDDGDIDPLQPVEVNSVYSFDLLSLTNLDLKLKTSMLDKVPHMLHPKVLPLATPTPDDKILVFSSIIVVPYPHERHTLADRVDFELYDPTKKKWTRLPGICDDWGPDRLFLGSFVKIHAHTFYKKSILLLQTDIGMLTLDLSGGGGGGGGWRVLDRFRGTPFIPYMCQYHPFIAIGDDLCLTPSLAYDIGKEDDGFTRTFNFPGFSPLGFDYITGSFAMTLLNEDVNSEKCYFCIMKAGLKRVTMNPHMTIHIYCTDIIKYRDILNKYREEDERNMMRDKGNMGDERKIRDFALPGTTLVKSFKFVMNTEPFFRLFDLNLFSIPEGVN